MVFELEGREVIERGVLARAIVEGLDVVEDHEFSGGFGGRHTVGEAFGLESSDEAFGQGVVVRISGAAHAGGDAAGAQTILESGGGILAAAIAVMDETAQRRAAREGLIQGMKS